MSKPDAMALQCLQDFEQAHPGAADLARYASLATRVDASLLRRLRLQLLPGLDAAAEADLWFSDLSQSRDGEALVFDPDIAAVLRERLRTERLPDGQRALDRAYVLMRELHAAWPAALQLEESLVYLALRQGPRAVGHIDALLRPAMAAMASQPQRGQEISRWVLRAMPTLPAVVRESEAARAMAVAASATLGADSSLFAGIESPGLPVNYRWLLPEAALTARARLRCSLRGADLLFQPAAPGDPDDTCIDLPATRPLMLELRTEQGDGWEAGQRGGQAARLLNLVPGVPVALPADWQQLELVCIDGQTYQLTRGSRPQAAPEPEAEPALDIFISCARRDDLPSIRSDKGWVSLLVDALVALLRNRLGRSVRLWHDISDRMDVPESASGLQMLGKARLLVCIVTPAYLQSDWCLRELQFFVEARQREGDGRRSRVFKVLPQPLPPDGALPPPLAQMLGYEFFELEAGRPRLLDPAIGDNAARQGFMAKASALAADMARWLMEDEARDRRAPSAPPQAGTTVYLAECATQLRAQRERLRTELLDHGHHVLPDAPLPTDEAACRAEVAALLARSALSLHLVGNTPARWLDGPQGLSIDALQNQLAAEQSRRSGLRRLIWLPPDARHSLQVITQQAFVDSLLQDAQAQFGADLLLSGFEELRQALHDSLHKLAHAALQPAPDGGQGGQDAPQVCVLCDAGDHDAVQPLLDWCLHAGLACLLPAFEGTAAEVSSATRQALTDSAAVILFWGAGSLSWLQAMLAELRKASAWRDTPLRAQCIYVSAARRQEMWRLTDQPLSKSATVIDGSAGPDTGDMSGFLRMLRGVERLG